MLPRHCVYTCLLGGYEALNEQPQAHGSDVAFICFTDDPALTSDTWTIRPIAPLFPADPGRSQRHVKILAHRHLPDFDRSLYIDNSVILQIPPEAVFAQADLGTGLCLPLHSFRASVLDEFLEVAALGLDDPGRIFEQLNQYSLEAPELLEQVPFWCGLMLRDHHDPRVVAAMETWFAHVLRYARRDQLSARMAFHAAGLAPVEMAIDNLASWFHRWPVVSERQMRMRNWQGQERLAPPAARQRLQEQEAARLRAEIARLTAAGAAAAASAAQALADAEVRWTAEHAALQGEMARHAAALAALQAAHAALAHERDALVTALGTERDALAAAHAVAQGRLQAMAQDLAALGACHREEAAQRAALAAEIQGLRASTSWRWTRPLRRIARRLRR